MNNRLIGAFELKIKVANANQGATMVLGVAVTRLKRLHDAEIARNRKSGVFGLKVEETNSKKEQPWRQGAMSDRGVNQ